MGRAARVAARQLAFAPTAQKDAALLGIASSLEERQDEVLDANAADLGAARESGFEEHTQDRLLLNPERMKAMASSVRSIAALADPIGEVMESRMVPSGLELERRRVPLGVVGVVYESRPNITVDIASLCLKSGNAVILRGGKEAVRSNGALAAIAADAASAAGLAADCVQFVRDTDHSLVTEMLGMNDYIDLLIPRGSAELVRMVAREATMPAVTGGIGVCHTYVDAAADLEMALRIVVNAKAQRPSVCNALDTVLVHADIADAFLPALAREFGAAGVEMRCDRRAWSILWPAKGGALVREATDADWGTEFLALIASVAIVDSLDEGLGHIERYGSGHSEAIVTEDTAARERFLLEVDAAAVFANASTRYNDGAEFGLGAEVAISTDKMHARGPMGLSEITSYKWVIRGNGQVRE